MKFKISFRHEADINSKQMFWWNAFTYMDSWLVLGVAFLEDDQSPEHLKSWDTSEGSLKSRKGPSLLSSKLLTLNINV